MKTFDEILQRHYIHDKGLNNPEYIKNAAFEFALQVAEAVKEECISHGIGSDGPLKIVQRVNITDFIK